MLTALRHTIGFWQDWAARWQQIRVMHDDKLKDSTVGPDLKHTSVLSRLMHKNWNDKSVYLCALIYLVQTGHAGLVGHLCAREAVPAV